MLAEKVQAAHKSAMLQPGTTQCKQSPWTDSLGVLPVAEDAHVFSGPWHLISADFRALVNIVIVWLTNAQTVQTSTDAKLWKKAKAIWYGLFIEVSGTSLDSGFVARSRGSLPGKHNSAAKLKF